MRARRTGRPQGSPLHVGDDKKCRGDPCGLPALYLTSNLFSRYACLYRIHRRFVPEKEDLVPQSPVHYRLIEEVKIRRESFGGILYKYGCADRGALSFINSPQLIELLIKSQQHHERDVSAAIASSRYSETSKQKLYVALDDLVGRGYVCLEA